MSKYLSNFQPKAWWLFTVMSIVLISIGVQTHFTYEDTTIQYKTLKFNSEFTAWRVGVAVELLNISSILCIGFGLGVAGFAVMTYYIIDDKKIGYKYE